MIRSVVSTICLNVRARLVFSLASVLYHNVSSLSLDANFVASKNGELELNVWEATVPEVLQKHVVARKTSSFFLAIQYYDLRCQIFATKHVRTYGNQSETSDITNRLARSSATSRTAKFCYLNSCSTDLDTTCNKLQNLHTAILTQIQRWRWK